MERGICCRVCGCVKNLCGTSLNTLHSNTEYRKPPTFLEAGEAMSARREPIRLRMKQVRDEARMTQEVFCAELNRASAALFGDEGPRYRQGVLSKIETGMQAPTFDDIEVWAAVDPRRRGKLWLAWEEDVDSALEVPRRQGPSIIQEPPPEVFDNQPMPRRKPGQRRA